MIEWKLLVDTWIGKHNYAKKYESEIKQLFEIAFQNTAIPERSHFGFSQKFTSINLMFKSIYLIGIANSRIAIIVDTPTIHYPSKVIGISRTKELDLYAVSVELKNIKIIINDEILWKHYTLATKKITNSETLVGVRDDLIKGKYLLSEIFSSNKILDYDLLAREFEKNVQKSLSISKTKRLERLSNAPKKPNFKEYVVKIYIRNPDVVAEVLDRAKGYCEHCKKIGPFKRDSNGTDYLEVHHKIPLSENGDDTVENAIALCANCHRQAHFGKKTFKLK